MEFFAEHTPSVIPTNNPEPHPSQKEFDLNEEFDLEAFFAQPLTPEEKQRKEEQKDLIITLHDESQSAVATFVSRVSADTFAQGASLTSGVFASLNNFIGACGAFCFHGLEAAAGHAHSVGGIGSSLNFDNHGNLHFNTGLDALSRFTGLSRQALLSGKYSAEGILAALMGSLGQGVDVLFGFSFFKVLLDGLIPTPRPA